MTQRPERAQLALTPWPRKTFLDRVTDATDTSITPEQRAAALRQMAEHDKAVANRAPGNGLRDYYGGVEQSWMKALARRG